MRRAAKIDVTQPEIVATLRAAGYYVLSLAPMGNGVPDLLVVSKLRRAVLLEVKTGSAKLTPDEEAWHKQYPGPLYIVRDAAQALHAMQEQDYLIMEMDY